MDGDDPMITQINGVDLTPLAFSDDRCTCGGVNDRCGWRDHVYSRRGTSTWTALRYGCQVEIPETGTSRVELLITMHPVAVDDDEIIVDERMVP
jgi:hypothetical protein